MTERTRKLRCLIAAGGTAGHVLPCLAVAEELVRRGVRVTFAGSPNRAEARLVPEAGFELDTFRIIGLPRRPTVALARALLLAGAAPRACARILARRRPDVVLGGGGYVAGPMVFAAWTRRVPAALTEADAHLGLANRLAAPFARRVLLAYPIPGLAEPKYRVVGRPVRPSGERDSDDARRSLGLPPGGPALLIFGGSQGAAALNRAAYEAFAEAGPAVLHLCGERYLAELGSRPRRDEYVVLPWTDDFAGALAAVDLVVARAGGSIWEVAAAGRPAILVPSPNVTADHQTKNARHFEAGGGAVVLPESKLGDLRRLAESLVGDSDRLGAMREAMRQLARPQAAADVADELVALAGGRR